MNIQIEDLKGRIHRCDSGNTHVIADWFKDVSETLMSANAAMMPYRLYIWPSSDREMSVLSGPGKLKREEAAFSAGGLRDLGEALIKAADCMQEELPTRKALAKFSRCKLRHRPYFARSRRFSPAIRPCIVLFHWLNNP